MQPTAVVSRIRAVSVYRVGARVTRVAELRGAGQTWPARARITGLPLALDDGSVRVRVEPVDDASGAASGLPVATDVRVALEVPDPDESLPPADHAELKAAQVAEARLRSRVSQHERELARISNLRVVPRPPGAEGEPPRESPTRARLALVALRERREQELRDELARIRDALDEATRQREALEDRERRASTARQARAHELRKSVHVTLRGGSGTDTRAQLCVEYLVPGARWAPAYSVQLDDEMSRAELSLRAHVAQNTGEDWSGVELNLSTADAQRWTELPELHSLRIGRRQPPAQKRGWRPPPVGVDELYRDYDRGFAAAGGEPEVTEGLGEDDAAPLAEYAADAEDTGRIKAAAYQVSFGAGADFEEAETGVAEPPMPPPAPQAAPAAYAPGPALMPEAAPRMAKRGGVLGGLFGRSHATSSAREMQSLRDEYVANALPEEAVAGAIDTFTLGGGPPAVEPALEASREMMSYGTLRMPPARSAERGRLTVVAQQEVYLELLVRQRVAITLEELRSAIGEASARSRAVERADLPPRCRPAWSEDYDYGYVAESLVDVPSDGDFHSLPVRSGDSAAEPLYIVVPRESTDVFRTVALENPLDAPLLPGPVDVYWRGDFLLTSEVELTPPRARVRLGLGVEQAIKVSRNTRFREESAGLIGGSLDLHHQILIEALNHTTRSVALEVRERVPVIRDDEEEIRIDVKEVDPEWEPFDPFPSTADAPELRGGYRWRLRLEPGRTENLRVNYTVRIPAKLELVGGNRREV